MLSTLPVTNERVIDTIQWPISSPANTDSDNGIVRFSDCKMNEGVTARDMFDAYKEFDAKVSRTKDRPIASGSISIKLAIIYSLILCFFAFLILLNFSFKFFSPLMNLIVPKFLISLK